MGGFRPNLGFTITILHLIYIRRFEMDVSELTDHVLRLSTAIADQEKKIRDLESRIDEIEQVKRESVSVTPKVKLLNIDDATILFWKCSPRQHALIQLVIVLGSSNQELADRFGLTLASIKTRFRHMCGRLSITGRSDLEANYKSIFEAADAEYYEESTRIEKTWARVYGRYTFKQAQKKDPYHKVICETHYRGANLN